MANEQQARSVRGDTSAPPATNEVEQLKAQLAETNRKLDALWLWLPLTVIFVGVFFDRRRPFRLLPADG